MNNVNDEPNAIGDSGLVKEKMSFKEEYGANISSIMSLTRGLFERAEWSGNLIKTHPSARKIDMDEIYVVMRKLGPTIGNELKVDSSNINKFPDIKKVLTNFRGARLTCINSLSCRWYLHAIVSLAKKTCSPT